VLAAKERIEGEIRDIAGKKCVITLHPIVQSGRSEGIIAKLIFHRLDQWKDVFRRLEQLESELTYYRGELNRITKENAFDRIVSQNGQMNSVKKEAYLAAKGFSTILICGESGTGKELFAEAIHEASGRTGKFIKVNCAAIPSELLEAEFFGYVEGAFTGARKGGKPGKFELADRGTLFLDEIGDMPPALQAKLLRVGAGI
jgi:transcriptional regulator with PAS, ATPase and Fis domain